MIAVWMLYCLGIGLAFLVVGHALERGLHLAGRPTRWAWIVALAGSYLVPAAAWLRPDGFASFAAPIPVEVDAQQPASSVTTSTTLDQPPSRSFSLADLDLPLRWGWGVASVAILCTVAAATTRLVSLRRRWRRATVDGRSVLVSRNVGPAVVGVWSPRVVVPEWALTLSDPEREMMLAHEEQHVRSADPALLAVGFVLVLLAPWNLALWWQWRRLRLAVEMDCDARVLLEGRSAAAYGELLLDVGRRRAPQLLGVAAFGEPASFLESRIRRMLTTMPRWRWAGVAAAVVVALGAIMAACETPRPVGPAEPVEAPAESARGITGRVSEVIAPTDVDQAPAVLSDATTYYPDLPRLAGVAGRVIVRARIEANGRADPSSVTVEQSPHPALAQAAKSAVLRALFRPARANGQAVAAVVHVVYDFVITSSSVQQRAREVMDRVSLRHAERLRPWVESTARRMVPSMLKPNGPPMDVILVHDARLQVYQATLTTLNYLGEGGDRPGGQIEMAELKRAVPFFEPGHDAWGVVDPRGLRGLVRDNVRVIWIHHDPQPVDSSRQRDVNSADRHVDVEQLRRLAREYHPEVFGRVRSPVAVALVLDSQNRVLAHAAKTGEARGPDGSYYSGEDCRQVLERLVPQYHNTRWSVSGCADYGHYGPDRNVIVYWGVPLLPLTR